MAEYERNYYVICDDNCKFPSMTYEQILAAIAEATGETPTHVDDAFISKIRELNRNNNLRFWLGTTAEYNALANAGQIESNCLYIITDDAFGDDVSAALSELQEKIEELRSTTEWKYFNADGGYMNEYVSGVTVGSIKVVGKIAFFDIKFNLEGYDYERDFNVKLPITLDTDDAYVLVKHTQFDQEGEQSDFVIDTAVVTPQRLVVKQSTVEWFILGSFSFPIA